jgi:acyl-CoA synthetase (NDP forming)
MTLDTPDDLSGLFAPTSVAVVGASSRAGRPGRQVIENLQLFDPTLAIYPITPRYDEVLGLTTYPDLASSPGADLVVLAGSSDRAEGELEAAIAHGARGVLVFGAPAPGAIRPPWLARLGAIAKEGGVPMLGPDTLGYVNYAAGRGVTWALPEGTGRGGVAVVSQSGTVFWEGITCDPRMRFSFAAHSGLEASTTISDLVKYAVCLESTRVLGLYVETVRDPDDFLLSLELAEAAEVPVVAMYAGRTDKARRQLMTHAGRLAGDHATFEAVFRRHGVARAHTSDEWWTTLTLLGSDRRVGEGGLAAVMDSGGGLAMFLDYADELGLPLADLRPATVASIQDLLGHEILAEGAIDFWVGDSDRHARTEVLLDALVEDETTAAVMAFTTYGEATTAGFATPIAQACAGVAGRTGKPVVAATYTARQLYPGLMLGLAEKGVPVLRLPRLPRRTVSSR